MYYVVTSLGGVILPIHFEPLRPNRSVGVKDKYEFTHGTESVCVYDIETLDFIKEIPVGPHPDCHATSIDAKFLYIACHDGLYCISQESLSVAKFLPIEYLYAVNFLPDGNTLLLHDQCGGVIIIKNPTDMEKIHVHKRIQVIPDGKYRCEIGGKGNFTKDGKYYLCSGWHGKCIYIFNVEDDFSFEYFIEYDEKLMSSDDLVMNSDRTKAYTACHVGKGDEHSHVAVIDIEKKEVVKVIETGGGSCGLTMTNDERYVIVSNDKDDSISVIDTQTDTVINTPCAREGFDKLGIKGYIQGITCGENDSIYVYGCSGNGAIVRFDDITKSNKYTISYEKGKYTSEN